MNSLKTTALMFTGGCLSLCVTASPVQSLQLHFQSPDGQTSADLLFGNHVTFGNSYVGPMGIELYQDPTKDPIDSFLKGESHRVYYHNGSLDPYLASHFRNNKPAKCDARQCLLPLNSIYYGTLHSTPSTAVITQSNGQWHFHTVMGSPWKANKSSPYPTYSMGLFRLSLNCASDLLSCVGSSGTMSMFASSSQHLWYEGPMQFVGFTNSTANPTPVPTPTPTPHPTRVPEPSVVLGLLFLSGLGLLKKRRI
ncbi:MAG: PEP-CTERM sorting domain-containing protein [Roseofilum sp. SBFL]|uniref:PEP-CTERM sorting domain-containing protein n=1 Tax=unclassified Roseofilum TaxID=2620099 RepID=UPI001B0FAF90|nr:MULTISPECIES: PEP-CTERM sorting domain-containing protein [unclassified Roseofilum]MBP0011967.1 PEP-CTERM sorting domain-containing protein [Roseofilum sp. SID3]MBP0022968.1 PEP-CTERM sorting domain-containing protein [Roseofilum sp. SID2]MBP0037465.1 PEP-CTERM sorting domain-containing protein [Roseofilum sp. SID1]MBP0044746.1 PEP-CTERM sorting domain-containing protein [Roseofilum sp. SBFL]